MKSYMTGIYDETTKYFGSFRVKKYGKKSKTAFFEVEVNMIEKMKINTVSTKHG